MSPDLAVLRSSGTALVLDTSGPGLPRVLHWGADLPDDAVAALPLLAQGPVPHSASRGPTVCTRPRRSLAVNRHPYERP